MKKAISLLLCAASMMTACHKNVPEQPEQNASEQSTSEQSVAEQSVTEQSKMGVNTELLLEFGMTFEELEEKYGKAVRRTADGKDFDFVNAEGETQTFVNHDYIYYFERGERGYTFMVFEADDETTPEGVLPVPARGAEYPVYYQISDYLTVKDLFTGMEEGMTVKDFIDAVGHTGDYDTMKIPADDPWITPYDASRFPYKTAFWHSSFNYNGLSFNIGIEHAEEGIIEPDSRLRIHAQ